MMNDASRALMLFASAIFLLTCNSSLVDKTFNDHAIEQKGLYPDIKKKINVHGGVRSQNEPQPQCQSVGINRHNGTEEAICEQHVKDILKCDPDGINQFRRKLAIEDPTCYERSFAHLAANFIERLDNVRAHLHLHIPKAGGTTLCELAKLYKSVLNPDKKGSNCWEGKHFYPAWMSGDIDAREDMLDNKTCHAYMERPNLPEFVMNENYLDLPMCPHQRIYSMVIREPVDRAMSNERHLYNFRDKSTEVTFLQRKELVRHKYITWALSAGASSGDRKFQLVPQEDQLDIAKDTLSRFDFLVDFTMNDTSCLGATLELMGIRNTTIGQQRKQFGKQHSSKLKPREMYQLWNSLDLKLYEYAQQLMDIDCRFFLRLMRGYNFFNTITYDHVIKQEWPPDNQQNRTIEQSHDDAKQQWNSGLTQHNLSKSALAVRNLASPKTAAARLQDPQWIAKLQHHVSFMDVSATKRRRVLEWTVESNDTPDDNGIELFLMPSQGRGFLLVELFLEGRVHSTMGENVAMMGWAKAALALGCKKVVMFDSYVDFVNRLDKRLNQFYMMDYLSLPKVKDDLLLDPMLRQRTWDLAWWGRAKTGPNSVKEKMGIDEKYGFKTDHTLVPFNYTDGKNPENIRMTLLPSAITFNHMELLPPKKCHVFYMGKSVIDVQNSTTIINLVEQKLSEHDLDVEDLRLCTAFEVPEHTSYEEVLGFQPKYTVNVGRMKPNEFAYVVGNAKVVVGSGL
jgi:hypothetical protein